MNGISSFLMGSAPAGAGKGLCDRPLQPFATPSYGVEFLRITQKDT